MTEKPKTARQLCDVLGSARHIKSSPDTKFGGHKQGDGFIVTWLSGHMFRLLEPHEYNPTFKNWSLRDLPIIYSDIQWKPIDKSEKISPEEIAEQIDHIKSLYLKVNELVLATDGDQEGQVLGQVFLEQTGWTGPVKRLWTDLWEPSGLQKSLNNLRDNADYQGTYYAGISRIILDQLVGINLTRLFTLKAGQSGFNMVANTGRVRSCANAIVVDHDARVKAHAAREYHTLRGVFEYSGHAFNAKLIVPDHLLEDKTHCFDRQAIETIQSEMKSETMAHVVSVSETESRQKPPKPFSQNTLAQFCNLHYGLLPDETEAANQSLYEAGYASYPRVEVEVYETDVLYRAPETLSMLSGLNADFNAAVSRADINSPQPVFCDAEVAGHSAIFVSSLKPDLNTLSQNEQIVYKAIAMRFVAQFSSDMVTAQSAITLKIKNYYFLAESQILVSAGWSTLEPKSLVDKPHLPKLPKDASCSIKEINLHSRNTKAPNRLTVDVFLATLKDCTHLLSPKIAARVGIGQIGTGATQPSVLKTLEDQGVAQVVDRKYVVPTNRGRTLRSLLPDLIASPDLTSVWELNFRAIRAGQLSHIDFIRNCLDWLSKVVIAGKSAKYPKSSTLTPCEVCGSALNRKKPRDAGSNHYWMCSNEDCRISVPEIAGLPMKLHPQHGQPCGKCGTPMVTKFIRKDNETILVCNGAECKQSQVRQ